MAILKRLKDFFLNEKFLKYCLLGIVNTLNTAWISSVLSLCLQQNIAAGIGYVASLTIAYLINSNFVFRHPMRFSGYVLFLLTYIPNFLIYMSVTFVTINIIDLRQFWATVLAAIAGVPVTFTLMKLITFKKPTK
ncbi:MAG: GtrA family protein [Clostridia bacterium]|nr:GtrA family protein [Clostridia bacterium]